MRYFKFFRFEIWYEFGHHYTFLCFMVTWLKFFKEKAIIAPIHFPPTVGIAIFMLAGAKIEMNIMV